MYVDVFIRDFSELGRRINSFATSGSVSLSLQEAMHSSLSNNSFFTFEMQREALFSLSNYLLDERLLTFWIKSYNNISEKDDYAGVVAAGNIPAVAFHDIMSVLASGYKCEVKLSKRDRFLIPWIIHLLSEINQYWRERVLFVHELSSRIKMIIAAGSDATMKILGGRFAHLPSLLRGTKTSLAVITGDESASEINNLCKDIFLYFGMGCRSVSKIFAPEGYDFTQFLESSGRFRYLSDNPDYSSSYKYQKAIMTMTDRHYIDGGYFLIEESDATPPPLAVLAVSYYKDIKQLQKMLDAIVNRIQVIEWAETEGFLTFGNSQNPTPDDYADGIDTVRFLLSNGQE